MEQVLETHRCSGSNCNCAESARQFTRLHNEYDALSTCFHVALCEEFPSLLEKHLVIRKGWLVVWIEMEHSLEAVLDSLGLSAEIIAICIQANLKK